MKKFKAFTMIELYIAIAIIAVMTAFCLSYIKPSDKKTQLFAYATVANLERAMTSLADTGFDFDSGDLCDELQNVFTTKTACSSGTLTLPNDVTLSNLNEGKKTETTYKDLSDNQIYASYRDVLIDINGSKKPNINWVDRIPVRIYDLKTIDTSPTKAFIVQPIDCSLSSKSTLCGSTTSNFLLDDKILKYDVYVPASDGEDSTTQLIASSQSAAVADRMVNGRNGLYKNYYAASANTNINPKCVTRSMCADENDLSGAKALGHCDSNAVPTGSPNNGLMPCFTVLHKPSSGAAFMIDSLIGDIDKI